MPEELVPVGVGTTTLAVADANVTDEISRAGMGLGELVLRTGQAVAETQNKLNATSAATATALATTLVDVIALQEKIYDDQGNIDTVKTHTRKLPLVNFIDPVVYEWTQVRLQGLFIAREFADASKQTNYNNSSSNSYGHGGLLVVLGAGYNTYDYKGSSSTVETDSTSDLSYGNLRMNALLQPRKDVTVPKPTQSVKGPRLSIIQGEIQDVLDAGKLVARTMAAMIEYRRRDGSPIANKAISIETQGVAWSLASGGTGITDANGRIEITLRREFLDEEADTAPQNFVVSARIGIVQNSSSFTF